MHIYSAQFQLHLPSRSLKEKRGRIKPLLARLHRDFNLSVAEVGLQDHWQEALICCAMVGSDRTVVRQSLQQVTKWVEAHWTDGDVIDQQIETI